MISLVAKILCPIRINYGMAMRIGNDFITIFIFVANTMTLGLRPNVKGDKYFLPRTCNTYGARVLGYIISYSLLSQGTTT